MEDIYNNIGKLAEQIVYECTEKGLKIVSAESCTGGMISAAITSVSGSSAVIELGVCSYSNRIKSEILGISKAILEEFSEYSLQCAEEMARGVLRLSDADFAIATSGIAGPSGGTDENPVGTVYISVCNGNSAESKRFIFDNRGRAFIRAAATEKSLEMLLYKIRDIRKEK